MLINPKDIMVPSSFFWCFYYISKYFYSHESNKKTILVKTKAHKRKQTDNLSCRLDAYKSEVDLQKKFIFFRSCVNQFSAIRISCF